MKSKFHCLSKASFHFLCICILLWGYSFSQVNYELENAKYDFPDTKNLRDKILKTQSDLKFIDEQIGKMKQVLDYIQQVTTSQNDSTRIAILETAIALQSAFSSQLKIIKDSYATKVLRVRDFQERIAKVQAEASKTVKVDGTIYDKLPTGRVYFVRQRKSTDVFVITTSKSRNLGDEVTGYYRKIADRVVVLDAKRRWQVYQKGQEPHGAISSFDLYEETIEPTGLTDLKQLQEEYQNALKELSSFLHDSFSLLSSDIEIRMSELEINKSTLSSVLGKDQRELYLKNLYLAGHVAAEKGQYLAALNAFLTLYNEDNNYSDVAAKLEASRKYGERTLRSLLFGEDGLKNMIIIPSGKCDLSSGESFKTEIFLIDSLAVTNEQYDYFEKVTGYKSQANWRAGYNDATKDKPVLNLTDADKARFAEWAGKMMPSINEIEYIRASGFETLTEKNQYYPNGNFYGVTINETELRCILPLNRVMEAKQSEIEDKADAIKDAINEKIKQLMP